MKIIIAGGRDFNDYQALVDFIGELVSEGKLPENEPIEIVSGMARGADALGVQLAKDVGFDLAEFPADWNRYGRSAGYRRNAEMGNYADVLIACWDGQSKGTQHMIDYMQGRVDKPVYILNY